jgi:hypothetical protein
MRRRIWCVLIGLLICPQVSLAQASNPDDMEELKRRIDILAQEIEQLKLGEAAVTADQSQFGLGPAASKIYRTQRGVSIGGYGEMVYNNFATKKDDGSAAGKGDQSDFLRAIIYVGYKFNNKWLLNTEFEFEHASTGKAGEASAEFVHLEYTYRPEFNLRFGLLLVPMGLVNELHEPTVYMGTNRPDIEQAIIPSTWRENGLGIYGDTGVISYRAYLVSGFKGAGFSSSGLRGGRQKGSKALTDHFALTGRIDVRPRPGVTLGGAFYGGYSGQDLLNGTDKINVPTGLFEGHVDIRHKGLWISALGAYSKLGEVADLNNALGLTGNNSIGKTLSGFYVQAGYDVLTRTEHNAQSLMPYARYETLNTQSSVPTGFLKNPARDVNSLTIGVAYYPESRIIFKADFKNVNNDAGTGLNQFNGQIGYIF